MKQRRLGLIINPVAGMGGAVGLKGTDGDRASLAAKLGATPGAAVRARTALLALRAIHEDLDILTCAGEMGGDVSAAAGLPMTIVYQPGNPTTTAADTRSASERMLDEHVDLILFAGGDGTARDLLLAIGDEVPVLGIPCGVKMHSAVFANSARAAGDVARVYLSVAEPAALLHDAEVIDREDSASCAGSPTIFGYVRTPRVPLLVAPAKAAGAGNASLDGACRRAAQLAADDALTLLGPGTTMRRVKRHLGFDGTLLGIDAVCSGTVVGIDLNEAQILRLLDQGDARLIVSPVGGQGFLFGRGNQQLSATVIRRVGLDRIIVVSTLEKLTGLSDARLLVDTGDEQLDAELAQYIPIIVGSRRVVQFRVCTSTPPVHGEIDDKL